MGMLVGILGVVFYATSGNLDRNTALITLAAAGVGVLIWIPWTLISAYRTLKELDLPPGFRRAVVLDKAVQGFLAALLIIYGGMRLFNPATI